MNPYRKDNVYDPAWVTVGERLDELEHERKRTMFQIDDEREERPRYRKPAVTLSGLFWTQFLATFLAGLLVALIVFLSARAYLHYSIKSSFGGDKERTTGK